MITQHSVESLLKSSTRSGDVVAISELRTAIVFKCLLIHGAWLYRKVSIIRTPKLKVLVRYLH